MEFAEILEQVITLLQRQGRLSYGALKRRLKLQAASMRFTAGQSLWTAYLSEAYLLAGRMDEAIIQARRALDLSREHKERGHQAWVCRLLGEIHSHRKPLEVESADTHHRQALALAEELGMRPLQAHCHLGLGTLYARIV